MIVYVVFTRGEIEHWWSHLTRKDYRHCYMLTPIEYDGCEFSLLLDARVNYLQQTIYTYPVCEYLDFDEDISEVYLVTLANYPEKKYIIDIRTCVTIIKLALNARWPLVQSPWALRNKLRKCQNAVQVR